LNDDGTVLLGIKGSYNNPYEYPCCELSDSINQIVLMNIWTPETHQYFNGTVKKRIVTILALAHKQSLPFYILPLELLYMIFQSTLICDYL